MLQQNLLSDNGETSAALEPTYQQQADCPSPQAGYCILQGMRVQVLPQTHAPRGQPIAAHMQQIVDVQDMYLAGSAQPQDDKILCKGVCWSCHD